QDAQGYIAFGTERGRLNQRTAAQKCKKDEPQELLISGLQPDTRYYYQLRAEGIEVFEGEFHTQRRPGSEYTFTVTADSHLDDRVSAPIYLRTLANARADQPDFNIDLGDTFMTEKHESRENASRQYIAQRYYFGQLCRSAGLFLVLGNHDGESPRGRGDQSESLAVWSNLMRKRYFPNPVPDEFYSGNAAKHPEAGLLQNYFAWQWGDAQFVVLDPFWYPERQRGRSDNWKRTLGLAQYQWLRRTLESSPARLKFVFIHHLVGGLNDQCRGGAEAAPLYEWGGRNADGSDGFKQNRPEWPAPIHQLLVDNHVSTVFHGHDHFYAKQDLDGIVYQEVPQPGTPGQNRPRSAIEYGYQIGVILGGPGHLRVRVTSDGATVDYVRAALADDERSDFRNAEVAHSYTIPARSASVR
ncbi:MAG: metallophosphoesterase family protein, partial [Planctomycetota bacterium]